MNASDFLYKNYGIAVTEHNKLPILINPADLLKYMEEYAALHQPIVSDSLPLISINKVPIYLKDLFDYCKSKKINIDDKEIIEKLWLEYEKEQFAYRVQK